MRDSRLRGNERGLLGTPRRIRELGMRRGARTNAEFFLGVAPPLHRSAAAIGRIRSAPTWHDSPRRADERRQFFLGVAPPLRRCDRSHPIGADLARFR